MQLHRCAKAGAMAAALVAAVAITTTATTAAAAATAATAATAGARETRPAAPPKTAIEHVVVIVQENHSFDSYFADYCRGRVDPKRRKPRCDGGPTTYPHTTTKPVTLDAAANLAYDPNHEMVCELAEIDHGKMDKYLTAKASKSTCGTPANFAYAAEGPASPVAYYQQLATDGALADRYFQPVAGQSTSNDMYLWTSRFVFANNDQEARAVGKQCNLSPATQYDDVTKPAANRNLGKALTDGGVSWAWYAEGYDTMRAAGTDCPPPPADCPAAWKISPCPFDPADVPAEYYASSVDRPATMRDYSQLASDLGAGTLPSVVFVKAIGYRTEHPGQGNHLGDGVDFVHRTVDAIKGSPVAAHTLILLTWDESGGFYDHVRPPATSAVDHQPYGPRIPLLAIGPFARSGSVSHQVMEHSSIVRFIEWNWLGATGQLHGRDRTVHNLGSLLAPGLHVPA
jgi:phospholipase C